MSAIRQLLLRSQELETDLAVFMQLRAIGARHRDFASRLMYDISFEHGRSVLLLATAGNFASANGLVRLQFEALVRALWLLYVASDSAMEHITRDLSQDDVERLPMVSEMLKSLAGKAPPATMATLSDFSDKALRLLNSFVHSGGYPYQRSLAGYTDDAVRQILVASNGLQWTCAFEAANMARDANAAVRLYGVRTKYADCLPQSAV